MNRSDVFLIAMLLIFALPYLVWRLARTDYYAPLVVVQILSGILLGPGILGAYVPDYYAFVFNRDVTQALSGLACWAVMSYVWVAGIELDLKGVWEHRRDTGVTAAFALGTPLLTGCLVAGVLLHLNGWVGARAGRWQFVLGVGMACAVTALPILVLLLEKLGILRQPFGQRVLRYASVDDLAIWGVLAIILLDWQRVGAQLCFLGAFAAAACGVRRLMVRLAESDRWYVGLVWLLACGLAADLAGLHFMVGAFLSGAVLDRQWFDGPRLDALRHHLLLVVMPVFFLSTGLRTTWTLGGATVFLVAAALLAASVVGKLAGTYFAGRVLGWPRGDSTLVGWLLQTKALIMIIFANVLLDRQLITSATFTALLLMAVGSTMLTVPVAAPRLAAVRPATRRNGVPAARPAGALGALLPAAPLTDRVRGPD